MAGRSWISQGMAAGAIAVLSLTVGAVGIATAANGGSLLLGRANHATSTTTLTNSTGTALSLVAGNGKPPLRVNSKTLVKNLNAERLDGLTASSFGATASVGESNGTIAEGVPSTVTDLPAPTGSGTTFAYRPVLLAATNTLPTGVYVANATALGYGSLCWINTTATFGHEDFGDSSSTSFTSVSVSGVFRLKTASRLRLYCAGTNSANGGAVVDQTLTAIHLAHYVPGFSTAPTAPFSP
jgi:hypothetical protein